MKKGNILVFILVLIFSLYHFSPHTVEAEDGEQANNLGIGKDSEKVVENEDQEDESLEKPTEEPTEEYPTNDNQQETIEMKEPEGPVENKPSQEENLNVDKQEVNEGENVKSKTSEIDIPKEEGEGIEIQSSEPDEDSGILKKGVRDTRVVSLKNNLARLGFPVPGNGTTYFGSGTEEQVKAFQHYYGLTPNGTGDEATLAKIQEILSSPLQSGNRDEATVTLKENLATLGFAVPGNGTTYFGSGTEAQVKAFQNKYDLVTNGIADEVTLAKIQELLNAPLSNGMYREDVRELKENLGYLGFPVPGNGTPLFGPKTEETVKAFQHYYGLTPNGTGDDTTLAKIQEILSSPLQSGNRDEATVTLKENLATLGFAVPGNGTTYFGSGTEAQVKAFQNKYDLVTNGIADEVTLAKIQELLNAPLSNGMYREDVRELKENLGYLGFPVPGNGTPLFGPKTEETVKAFQHYYGLTPNGTGDDTTLAKIQEILSSPLQSGNRDEATVTLKENLATLGFAVPGNGTTYFGSGTEAKVKEFQRYFGLRVNGIADDVTLTKIEDILSTPLRYGNNHEDTILLKNNLAKLGFPVAGNGTAYFGADTEAKVEEFQAYYGLYINGIADEITLKKITEILTSPMQNGKRDIRTVKLKEDLEKLGYHVSDNPTTLYGSKTEEKVKEFQRDYGLIVNGIADEVTLAEIQELLSSVLISYSKFN
ncbi:peptidoglycan-binding protein, partial [Virgibacillus halodenitrificans]|uniref:peptidoglycan-binding protein n=1 Tax=Virgibacillus halodenitrificans TaxID=1482 RepID=UPI002DBC8944